MQGSSSWASALPRTRFARGGGSGGPRNPNLGALPDAKWPGASAKKLVMSCYQNATVSSVAVHNKLFADG